MKSNAKQFILHHWPRLKWVLLVLCYLVILIVITYPWVLHLGSAIPGRPGDNTIFVWNLWWVKHSLVELGQHPFHCQYLFAPSGVSLTFHTLLLLPSVITIPFQYVFGIIGTMNMILIVGFILSGIGTWLMLRFYNFSAVPSFLGSLVFVFSPYAIARLHGHYNLALVGFFPWWVLCLQKSIHELSHNRWTIGLAVLAAVTFMTDLQVFFFAVVLTAVISLTQLKDVSRWFRRSWRWISVGVVVFVVLASPLIISISHRYLNNDLHQTNIVEQEQFSLDLFSIVTPSYIHGIWGDAMQDVYDYTFDGWIEKIGYLGIFPLVCLVVLAIRFRRLYSRYKLGMWMVVLFVGVSLSLGPSLIVLGRKVMISDDLPLALPMRLFQILPSWMLPRVPARFIVYVYLSLAVITAAVIQEALKLIKSSGSQARRRILGTLLVGGCIAVVMIDIVSAPSALNRLNAPTIYEHLPAYSGEGNLLTVPFKRQSGQWNIGWAKEATQLAQAIHNYPMVGGYISRASFERYGSIGDMPGIAILSAPWEERQDVDMDPVLVFETFQRLEVSFIAFDTNTWRGATTTDNVRSYLELTLGLEPYYEDESGVLYRIDE